MWCVKLILISSIVLVSSRPQSEQNVESTTGKSEAQVEIERQVIQEVEPVGNSQTPSNTHHSALRKMEDNTREILEKIAEVNKKQGLVRKKYTPSYFHFPFSYSRSQNNEQKSDSFKFRQDPFTNPIFEYLAKEQNENKNVDVPTFRRPNFDREYSDGFASSMTDTNPEIGPEDNIPGQYIKRKVTHYQSVLVPNPLMMNPFSADPTAGSPFLPSSQGYPNYQSYPMYPSPIFPPATSNSPEIPSKSGGNKNQTSIEKQTIENIKNIITGGQAFPSAVFPNYNNQIPQIPFNFPNMNLNPYQGRLVPNNQQINKARQNWNWPGAGFFPIYIRDPFLQMYYAVTNMIEYGPAAGSEGPCKLTPRPQGSRVKVNSKAALNNGHQVTLEMNKKDGVDQIKVAEMLGGASDNDIRYLDVEDIDLGDDDLIKFTINLPSTEGRGLKDSLMFQKMGWDEYISLRNKTALTHLVNGKLDFTSQPIVESKQSPPIKEQTLHIQELEDDPLESDKAEDISISNQGTKKVFSKDNTGNGIFIHKLKVRKGGVAIAGPGGIATAGSGGTAIVGPNGVAYTHPDGLAIAGSGTKVVAVDPSIDLNEVIKDTVLNGTRHLPNTRVGKVVAVGPVVYYNRG